MVSHKKQHFVPRSTPAGQVPYVWRFNEDGSDPRREATENLFHEMPAEVEIGPYYEFKLKHVVHVDDPMQLVRMKFIKVGQGATHAIA
jgi:hypothetical protein